MTSKVYDLGAFRVSGRLVSIEPADLFPKRGHRCPVCGSEVNQQAVLERARVLAGKLAAVGSRARTVKGLREMLKVEQARILAALSGAGGCEISCEWSQTERLIEGEGKAKQPTKRRKRG